MRNKILLVLILIAVVFSLLSIVPRYKVEKNNSDVEIIVDNNHLNQLVDNIDINKRNVLSLLKNNGLTGIAVYNDTIETLIDKNKITLLTANEIKKYKLFTLVKNSIYKDFPVKN